MEALSLGASARLISTPMRRPAWVTSRSSSAPPWVAQNQALRAPGGQQLLNHKALPGGPQPRMAQEDIASADLQQLVQQSAVAELDLWVLHLAFEQVGVPGLQQPNHEHTRQ